MNQWFINSLIKNRELILIILFFFCTSVFGNNLVIDSLKQQLQIVEESERVRVMCDLCWEYRLVNSDSALKYGNNALRLAEDLDDKKGIAQSYNDMGIIYMDQTRYDYALENYSKALQIRLVMSDSSGIASLYNKMGIIYQKQGKLSKALESQLKALEIYEALNHERWIAYSLNNIAIINFNIGDLETSLEYHKRSLEIRQSLNDQYGVGASYGNIANVLDGMGKTDEAISNYQRALNIFREIEDKEAVSVQLSNLGVIYLKKSQYNKALVYLEESLNLRELLGDKKAIASSMLKIGEAHMHLKNYEKAYYFLNNAKVIAVEIDVNEEIVQSYLDLSKLFSIIGEKDSTFKYLNLFTTAKDSVYNARLNQQIIDTQTKYDVERKDKDLLLLKSRTELNETQLKQKKTEIWLLTFVIISITGAAIFVIFRRRQKQKQLIDAATIYHNEKMMAAVIDGQEEERRKIARELHDGVGQTLAGIKINWINENEKTPKIIIKMLDNASTELRNISHQMMPKELEQFGLIPAMEGFLEIRLRNTEILYNFEQLNINVRFNSGLELGLFRILQELTGNIVQHSSAKTMNVQILNRPNNLIMIVADDGVGFNTKEHLGNGIGLMNIESRVEALKGNMNFESSPGNGTEVTIRIPKND